MLLLETDMLPTNRKFEDFMDFRDMIQGNSLNDRREMVQYISKKPRIGRALGGQATPASRQSVEKSMGDKRIAKPGDSLAEIFVESALAKNPNLFDKFYKQQSKISDGTEIIKRGLTSLPVVEASFGGFLKDFGIGIAKSVVGDIAGEVVGSAFEGFAPGIADALGTTAGKALFGAGTNALFDYGAKEVFGYGQGPSFENFATDALFRGVADYYSTPEDERAFFGELGLDEEEDAKKIKAIQDARKKIRASRLGELEFDTKGPRGGSRREEPAPFMDRVKQYGRYTGPSGGLNLKNLAIRAYPAAASAIMKASAVPAQPQGIGQQQIQPSRVARLSREVGGLRGITVPAKVDRNELNQRQITELSTKGFTIHKGKRITRQDLIGRTEYARRTKPLATSATGGLVSLKDNGGPVVSDAQKAYMNWLDSVGGPGALSKRGLQSRRIDEVIEEGEAGPQYFSYHHQGNERGVGMYDDIPQDYHDFPFAYPEHPAFRSLNVLGGGPGAVPPRVFRSLQKIAPSDSNREFVLRLLGLQEDDDLIEANQGGSLMGNQFSGMVGGDGHGMEDNVQMPIVSDGEQVATLAVSPKEYVVDAYTMSALGNGNADEGAKIMDETIKSIRRNAYGTSKQPNEINGTKALRSGLSSLG